MSATPRSRHAARLRAHRRRAQARARWLVLGIGVAVLLAVTFAVTAFSGEESAPGTVLAVWSTDSGSRIDIPKWVEKAGHRLVSVNTRDGYDEIVVEKTH